MTGFGIGCWIVLNLCITVGCWFVWSWSNDTLFTYLGEAEITPGNWEMCYTYDLMTIPARIVCFLCGVAAIVVFTVIWASFIGLVFF